ncbi:MULTISPECIES: xylulokinase [Micrococcaceae]|uniref:xylulokinase n=1 Tax=unclassified Kocuria TaxID=2649579 RepID=UPI00101354FC|nr:MULTISPECIES: xylulokinase [unclassified Kocuria]
MSTYVLGVDSSTQSCKAVLVDAATGEVVDERRASHPEGTEVDPAAWVSAIEEVTEELLPRASAVAIGGQQHGMVLLDDAGEVIRPALLWNDTRSAPQAEELLAWLGGPDEAARRTGSVPVASYTATKVLWVRENEPENAERIDRIALPHDYLTWILNESDELWTDHGEASGTSYYDPSAREWLPEVAAWAAGHDVSLPRLAEPHQVVGKTASGALIGPGTGDNAAAALGLGMKPGDVSISIGTSGVVAVVSDVPSHDASGSISGFADASGRYLPLATTLNGAQVFDRAADLLGIGHEELSALALAAEPGSGGAVFVPYFAGERTPNLPEARAQFLELGSEFSRQNMARAMMEGLACSMAECLKKVQKQTGTEPQRVLLIGGGAKSEAFQKILAGVIGGPILLPESREFVALGAARQAAWVLSGETEPPVWETANTEEVIADPTPEVYERYIEFRNRLYPDAK